MSYHYQPFDALRIALDAVRSLRGALDAELARQVRRAVASVALNLSEGRRRSGKDRRYHWRVRAGSADEARTALWVAEAFGYLRPEIVAEALELLDRILAMLWRMTR